ncbi:MAG: hypothetical protein K2W92_02750 [Alphaproteobacteria bacterium]|nr:hypothetical protein [Alphaproteobacteria bacterium]
MKKIKNAFWDERQYVKGEKKPAEFQFKAKFGTIKHHEEVGDYVVAQVMNDKQYKKSEIKRIAQFISETPFEPIDKIFKNQCETIIKNLFRLEEIHSKEDFFVKLFEEECTKELRIKFVHCVACNMSLTFQLFEIYKELYQS